MSLIIHTHAVSRQMKELENTFLGLKKALLKTLKDSKEVTTEDLLESLTILLPVELETEYGESILEKLPELEKQETISRILT